MGAYAFTVLAPFSRRWLAGGPYGRAPAPRRSCSC